jgi:hypothetical protein
MQAWCSGVDDDLVMVKIPSGLQRHCPGTTRLGSNLLVACAWNAIGVDLEDFGEQQGVALASVNCYCQAPPYICAHTTAGQNH